MATTNVGDPNATLIMTTTADPSETVFMTIDGFTKEILTDMASYRRRNRRSAGQRQTIALEIFAGASIVAGTLLMTGPVVFHSFIGQLISLFM